MTVMMVSARRRAAILTLFLLLVIVSVSALPAAAPASDESYLHVEFGEITSNPERFRDKRVCVKGGWIRSGILVDVDRINQPYKCTVEVERFDPKVIEQLTYRCIRHYGEHVEPKIRLWWDTSEVKGVAPEACVIACGLFTVNQPPGFHPDHRLEEGTIKPCP